MPGDPGQGGFEVCFTRAVLRLLFRAVVRPAHAGRARAWLGLGGTFTPPAAAQVAPVTALERTAQTHRAVPNPRLDAWLEARGRASASFCLLFADSKNTAPKPTPTSVAAS